MRAEINKYIVIDSEICHGKPTFKGTRIMVWQVLEMLGGGMSKEDIIADYPALKPSHIMAALHYSAALTRGTENAAIKIPVRA